MNVLCNNSFTGCTHRLLSAIPLLKSRLEKLPNCKNISIAFPDDGAFKRFNSQLPTWPTIICSKIRDGDKRIVTIKDGNNYYYGTMESVKSSLILINTQTYTYKYTCYVGKIP